MMKTNKAAERLKPIPRLTKEEQEKKSEELYQQNQFEEMRKNVDGEHMFESASLEDYEKAEVNETKKEFTETDKEEMTKEILSLRNEIEFLKGENTRLKEELEKKPSEIPSKDVPTAELESMLSKISKLENENDEMILKNSELEFQIAKLREVEKTKQAEIDSFKHTYTKSNYDPRATVRGGGFRSNMNGYQEWR